MAENIICPVCGEANQADMEFCQNCQSRLLPLTGSLKDEEGPIHPGQAPTKKTTAELEPILPEWLREARRQARQSSLEEPVISGEQKKTKPLPQSSDLLAGLVEQNKPEDEDEVTPDWLASITGAPATQKKSEADNQQVNWVELGHEDKSIKDAPEMESQAMPWMANQNPTPEKDELTEWFKQASGPAAPSGEKPVIYEFETPTIARPNSSDPTPPAFTTPEIPEELKASEPFNSGPAEELSEPAISAETEIPDWIKKLDAQAPATAQPALSGKENSSSSSTTDIPDWLKDLDKEPVVSGKSEPGSDAGLPDWLTTSPSPAQEPAPSPAFEQPPAEAQSENIPESKPVTGELPDWITSLTAAEPPALKPGEPPVSAFLAEQPAAEPAVSAFSMPDEQPPEKAAPTPSPALTESSEAGNNDVDAIFASMQIPDWLSDVTLNQPTSFEGLPPAAQSEESIEPADLPSWVQAMRPVETAMRDATAGQVDTRLEMRGALAGLQGVLPVIPGAADPTSKPKSHSIKLDATEQQQAHATLLEQMLSAETSPVPMKGDSVPRSQRVLRWALSAVLIVVLGGVVFGGTQIFPLPAQVPNETIAAVRAVEAIPADAPVLVVFDYEPATIGEMEASGASLIDHLLLLKHPRLALISTSPTGAALAERFMTSTLAERSYLRGAQYVDLGYLPGGLAGVFDFSLDPTAVMPLGADSNEVWSSPVMQGVTHLSDFASIIVLTDSVEAGRTWIEQTTQSRGNTSLVMVSSAQAGPMILPYVDSGQVNGLVAGLNGAAGAEQANGGLPGFVRRYWDAYSLGLLLAVVLIFAGGVWNFWLGIQDHRIHEAG